MVTYAIFGLLIALIFIMSQKGKNVPTTTAAKVTETIDEDDYDDGF